VAAACSILEKGCTFKKSQCFLKIIFSIYCIGNQIEHNICKLAVLAKKKPFNSGFFYFFLQKIKGFP